MKTIVAMVDFSDVTSSVVEQASKLARAFHAQLILNHVVPEEPAVVELGLASPVVMQAPSEKKIEADYNRLASLRDTLSGSDVNVTIHQLEDSNVEKVLDTCDRLEANLIVVGSHHHSPLYNLFVGTFTGDILKRARCPVLVVPAPREKSS